MIDELIKKFSDQTPVTLMFRSLFTRLFSAERLDNLFSKYRQRQFESPVLFSYLVHLVTPVVSGCRASVNASYLADENPKSLQAVYDKLQGVEPGVSAALVVDSVSELRKIQEKTKACHRDPLPGYHTYIIDGKTFNATEHRIEESRTDARAPLPGRLVAVLDTRYRLFVDVACCTNAMRCERKILEPILDRLEAGAVYVADRNFSDGVILQKFYQAQAYFVIRQHGACPSWREIGAPVRKSRLPDAKGGKVSEQNVEVRLADGTWKVVRRVVVKLRKKTRDGDQTIVILTNLRLSVSARQIANCYANRWTIETCLGHLAQSLNAEIKTLCYPKAAGFCFCLGLLLYNIMSTMGSLLEKHAQPDEKAKPPTAGASFYYMAGEITEYQGGLNIAIPASYWEAQRELSLAAYCRFLVSVAKQAQMRRYQKTGRGPIKPRPKRRFNGSRHIATQKLLELRTMTA